MDIFLLGAGRPARGKTPAALKAIAANTRALDWQLHSFEAIDNTAVHFLAGYAADEIISCYPQLEYTLIPNWEQHSILHTLLKAPFSGSAALIAYADTVFRQQSVSALSTKDADIVFAIDRHWQQRYQARSSQDLAVAETIDLGLYGGNGIAEFTGLIRFTPRVVDFLRTANEADIGRTLPDLLLYLSERGFNCQPFDVGHDWAEFNAPADLARFILGTKAETLARLEPVVQHSHIGKQISFSAKQWRRSPTMILTSIEHAFAQSAVVVRSSAQSEDNWQSSNAGSFTSHLNVPACNQKQLSHAIDSVIDSYPDHPQGDDDQILIQRFIDDARISGVVFTCGLETGAPYYRINFDDQSHSTESVTSGTQLGLRTLLVNRDQYATLASREPALGPVLKAVRELESLLCFNKLDIEFAVDGRGRVHIFQARPITIDHSRHDVGEQAVAESLINGIKRFEALQKPSPFVLGERNCFGNMPDWNPAEIIGTRPRPLAVSLYRALITDHVWATQRAEFGYRDVRPQPLIVSFCGQPYIDIRASLNSFIPASLPDELATRLVDAYLEHLSRHPELHDKIEFEIAFTAWTPAFAAAAASRLTPMGISDADINQLGRALKTITAHAIQRLHDDVRPTVTLNQRRQRILASSLAPIDRAYALLDDCRRYGTLAFAHAARAGFIATSLLNGLVSSGALSRQRQHAFMHAVRTVTSEFEHDKHAVRQGWQSRRQLTQRYGHLRPGTYDILKQAYWENPARYLACSENSPPPPSDKTFRFSAAEATAVAAMLAEMGSEASPEQFRDYLHDAIRLREAVKFDFTHNLSSALDACVELAAELGLSRKQIAYLEFADLEQLKVNQLDPAGLRQRIAHRQQSYAVTQLIELPPVIYRQADFYCFERHASTPNYVSTGQVVADIATLDGTEPCDLQGKIVLLRQADPGYDWLFGQGISGLITEYGGANSHMAIRAAEIGLPAAIGVGRKLYEYISGVHRVELDCNNQIIRTAT